MKKILCFILCINIVLTSILPASVSNVEARDNSKIIDSTQLHDEILQEEVRIEGNARGLIKIEEAPATYAQGKESEYNWLIDTLAKQEQQAVKTGIDMPYKYTKKDIEKLLLEGASPEDIYMSYYLGNEKRVAPTQLLMEKLDSGQTWVQLDKSNLSTSMEKSEKQEELGTARELNESPSGESEQLETSTNDVVLNEAFLENSEHQEADKVLDETSSEESKQLEAVTSDEVLNETPRDESDQQEEGADGELINGSPIGDESDLNALIMNVNSVLNGLITPQMINQTNRPQYADREGSSESIDPVTGKLVWKQTQISLPGRDGLDLNIGIMYDSNHAYFYNRYEGAPGNIRKYNYSNSRYDLGIGWSFQFPSVQISEGYLFYHDGQGAVYTVDMNSSDPIVSYTHLVDYQGKDLRFMQDSQGQFNNGEATSTYYLEHADKKREYFASDGRLLGIQDRYGNQIIFKHIDRTNYNGQLYKVISSITDSIGRIINFDYESTLQTTGTFSGETIMVTVHDLNNTERQRVEYKKRRASLIFNGNPDGYGPILDSVQEPMNQNTYFDYEAHLSYFDVYRKSQSSNAGSYSNHFLTTIYSDHSTSHYNFGKVVRNWTSSGFSDEYRVSQRLDKVVTAGADQGEIRRLDYSYIGDYTGYPTYYGALPESYNYSSTATTVSTTAVNGLVTTNRFNGKGQPLATEMVAANGEKKILRNMSFHNTFKYLPTLIQQEIYAAGDSASTAEILQQQRTYTEWGGLSTESDFVDPSMIGDSSIVVTYTYEPTFMFLQSKTWHRDSNGSYTDTYAYYSDGRLKSYTNAVSETTNYCYYAINASQQESNNCTNPTYILSGQIKKVIETKDLGNGKTSLNETLFSATSNYAYPEEIRSQMTTREVNGQPVVQTVKKSMQYDMGSGRLLSETDGDNNQTVYTYDLLGRVTSIQYPEFTNLDNVMYKVVDEYTYTETFVPSTALAEIKWTRSLRVDYKRKYTNTSNQSVVYLSNRSSYYNGFGDLLYEITSGSGSTQTQQYSYNDQRSVVYALDPIQNSFSAVYNAWGELAETTDPFGNLSVMESNLKERKQILYLVDSGNVSAYRTNPTTASLKSNYLEQSYDTNGRLISNTVYATWPSLSQPVTESYSYDRVGNLTSYTDPKGNASNPVYQTTYGYDGLNRLVRVNDALGQITVYQYDANGQLSQATIQAGVTGTPQIIFNKEYTERGDLAIKADPVELLDLYGYNHIGLQVNRQDRNNTTFISQYDEQYRRVVVSASGANSQTQQSRITMGSGSILTDKTDLYQNGTLASTVTSTMDLLKRITSNTITSTGFSSYTGLSYDNGNRITMLTSGNSISSGLFATRYKYDRTRLDKVQINGQQMENNADAVNIKYAYFPNGQLQSITYPPLADSSIIKTEYSYDALGRILNVINKKGTMTLSSTTYTYDKNGNILTSEQVMKDQATVNSQYIYDKLNRLLLITRSDGSGATYKYDLKGNRLTVQENQPLTGDLSNRSYAYDLNNNLTQVTKAGESTTFAYAADGLRYKKTSGSNVTQYRYNTNGEIITEVDGNNKAKAHYVRGDRLLVKKEVASGQNYYYLYNGHGDVIQLIDTSGNIVNSYIYDEWGNIRQRTDGTANSFLYAGEVYDQETGLYYLRARYYDPSIGRFINEDMYEGELNNPLSLNLYTYVANNPLRYVDPSGHAAVIPRIIGGLARLIGGGIAITAGVTIGITQSNNKVKDFAIPVPITISEAQKNRKKDEKITLYHATSSEHAKNILEKGINIFAGRDNLDFGEGFYVTNGIEQAQDWIKSRFDGSGEILIFQVDEDVFNNYNGKTFKGNTKEWRNYVYYNRMGFSSLVEHYDYVEGPYLKNPQDKDSKNRYKSTGHQVAIKNVNLAKDVFSGYVGSFQIMK